MAKETIEQIINDIRIIGLDAMDKDDLIGRLARVVAEERELAAHIAIDNFEEGKLKGYGMAFDDVRKHLVPILESMNECPLTDGLGPWIEDIYSALDEADARPKTDGKSGTAADLTAEVERLEKANLDPPKWGPVDVDNPQPPKPMYHVVPVGGDTGFYYWFFSAETEEDVIGWLDELLSRTNKFSLIGELNDIQCECHDSGAGGVQSFPDKFAIPLKILNYVILPYGLRVEYK